MFFFFNDTAPTEIYPLSLHDALPISIAALVHAVQAPIARPRSSGSKTIVMIASVLGTSSAPAIPWSARPTIRTSVRSEEHTSELQSRQYLVCRLLLEKKKKKQNVNAT